MRVLALASYDSFLNTARLIAPYFRDEGCEIEYALVRSRRKPQITDSQISSFNFDGSIRWVRIDALCESGEIGRYDIVLSCLDGLSTRRLMHYLAPLGEQRPLIVSNYPGLVLRYAFDGYSMRTSSDLVWLNCKADYDAFKMMCHAFNLSGENGRVFGIAPLLQKIVRDATASDGPVVFFEQAIIPRYYDERLYLAEQLILLANRFPDRFFLVKPRISDKDATLHQTWYAIEPLLVKAAKLHGGWPHNLALTRERANILLESASHCLTVNSTVAIEAMHAGISTTVIGDFGSHEEYGLSYFFGSGVMRTFAEIELSDHKVPHPEWLTTHVTDPKETVERLVREAIELAKHPRQSIAERSLCAELSPELRAHLLERHSVSGMLSRTYRKKKKPLLPLKLLSTLKSLILR